jgi:hypothetical protein
MKKIILTTLVGLGLTISHGNDLPKLAFTKYSISDESNDKVHELVKEGSQLVFPEPRKARVLLVDALTEVSKGAKIDQYDYLWTQYGLMKSSMESGGNTYGPGTKEDYAHIARNVLKFLASIEGTGQWAFTKEGAFKMEVCRTAGNGLGWDMMEEGTNLEEALTYVNKAVECMRGDEDNFIFDTKVRILLKMKRTDDAYAIVKSVLDKDADFGDFQDIKNSTQYNQWLKK